MLLHIIPLFCRCSLLQLYVLTASTQTTLGINVALLGYSTGLHNSRALGCRCGNILFSMVKYLFVFSMENTLRHSGLA
jgi:hypothetical protein